MGVAMNVTHLVDDVGVIAVIEEQLFAWHTTEGRRQKDQFL